jgi:hypothetical protein
MIFEYQYIQITINICQLKMIDNTEDRYIIFESEENQLSRNLWQMMIIDQDPYIDILFLNLKKINYLDIFGR